MKITWFGGSTFRLYVGGKIIVTDAGRAPDNADPHEIAAAADHRIDLSDGSVEYPYLEPETWSRPRHTLLDEPEEEILALYTLSGEGIFVDEPTEGPLIVAPAGLTAWGRFADNAVVVLFGRADALIAGATALFVAARPRVLMFAVTAGEPPALSDLAKSAGQCAIQVLEPGLAIEA